MQLSKRVTLCCLLACLLHWSELIAQNTLPPSPRTERVFSATPAVFFEEYPTWANVSRDGRWAIYAGWTGVRVIDVIGKREAPDRIWPGVSDVYSAAWGPHQSLILYGNRNGKRGWYENLPTGPRLFPLPRGSSPVWSPGGSLVAYTLESVPDSVYVGTIGKPRALFIAGKGINGMAWLPDGTELLILAAQPTGTSQLTLLDVPTGRARVVAAELDAPPLPPSPIAAAPDGRQVYVALASDRKPVPESRHQPHADRRLGIYAIDLQTGARKLVVPPPAEGGDAMAPSVGGGTLFWTYTKTDASVVVIPAGGGPSVLVMRGALVPSWRPDGRQIGFCYGDWRWADWAIAWDGGAVDVDDRGRPTGQLHPIITGYHEDFQPVWSPGGHWIAYHSHRPKIAVPYYDAPSATDDEWLRPVGATARDSAEIRLTDFGWEAGPPDWSRDGTRLIFGSWDRKGQPGLDLPYIVTIDTVTGRPLSHGRLPLPPGIHNSKSLAWSPVSDDIALEEEVSPGRHALWVVSSDGTRARKVTEFAMSTYGGVSWTRDGRAIVYPALTGGRMQIFRVAVDGGRPQQLSHEDANLFEPAVSPDSRLIAAARLVHTKEVWRMER